MNKLDKCYKIFLLIILSGYFDFIGSLRKFYLSHKLNNKLGNVDIRIRSREIFFSALLCYFTIRIKLYKHHIISLTIIFICLIISIIIEIIQTKIKSEYLFYYIIMQFFITICRVYTDTIDKYLFEFNYVNPFKLLFYKSIIETLLMTIFYNGIMEDIRLILDQKQLIVLVLIIYFIVSGFKTIYKILTVKIYSPMTRTLADSFLDIFFNIYYYWNEKNEKNEFDLIKIICFWIDQFLKCYNYIF